jgi:hypothetical protein
MNKNQEKIKRLFVFNILFMTFINITLVEA